MSKKLWSRTLALIMLAATFSGCATDGKSEAETQEETMRLHYERSDVLYAQVLGEFDAYYKVAKEADTVAERFALMAIAEAKLLESGVMLPSTANGGNYAISRVAPYSVSSVLWGNDSDRLYTAVIVNEDPLTPEIRDEMKAQWAICSTGAEYLAWAENYLIEKGMTLSDKYTLGYTSDPQTWDALATSEAADSEAIVNTYDGLLAYDAKNDQIPALAESYTVSEDGLTYTFKLRDGVQWTDYTGTVIEEVTADSFVAGFRHMLDAAAGLEYLVQGIVKNASEYLEGTVTDFAEVGVKAVDKYTLQYTLEEPTPYFTTMLGYNVFAPMSRAYFLAKGGAFGISEFAAAKADTKTYLYGTSEKQIAYCGPYVVSSATKENAIVFTANDKYWNKDAVRIKTLTWKFLSGKNATESYDLMVDGTFAGAGLNDAGLAKAKADGRFKKYAYVSGTDAASFPVFMNVNRTCYGNATDKTVAPTTLSDAEKDRTNLAMQNQNFRMAIATSLNREAYNATVVGEELSLTSLVNSYTPGNFVTLPEAVTVKINGTDKTYAAGTFYGQIMQDQLDADGVRITVWDPTLEAGLGSSSGFDGWYNVAYCRELLAVAVAELREVGVEITAEHPLKIEIPYYDIDEIYANRAASLEQSIEASTQGLVDIVTIKTGGSSAKNWYYATYYAANGTEANYNMMDNSGWGPDYGDPQTYLDTMFYGGYMLKCIGLY